MRAVQQLGKQYTDCVRRAVDALGHIQSRSSCWTSRLLVRPWCAMRSDYGSGGQIANVQARRGQFSGQASVAGGSWRIGWI